jgi:hypothetical protein
MPRPVFHHMTDHQIEATYEYLSAIRCIVRTGAFERLFSMRFRYCT